MQPQRVERPVGMPPSQSNAAVEFLMFALFKARNGRWPDGELGATEWQEARGLLAETQDHLDTDLNAIRRDA